MNANTAIYIELKSLSTLPATTHNAMHPSMTPTARAQQCCGATFSNIVILLGQNTTTQTGRKEHESGGIPGQ